MPAIRTKGLSGRLYDDLGGFEHIRKVRILKAFYRNPCPDVKPHYPCFSDLSIKVINRIYPDEFIADNM